MKQIFFFSKGHQRAKKGSLALAGHALNRLECVPKEQHKKVSASDE